MRGGERTEAESWLLDPFLLLLLLLPGLHWTLLVLLGRQEGPNP